MDELTNDQRATLRQTAEALIAWETAFVDGEPMTAYGAKYNAYVDMVGRCREVGVTAGQIAREAKRIDEERACQPT